MVWPAGEDGFALAVVAAEEEFLREGEFCLEDLFV